MQSSWRVGIKPLLSEIWMPNRYIVFAWCRQSGTKIQGCRSNTLTELCAQNCVLNMWKGSLQDAQRTSLQSIFSLTSSGWCFSDCDHTQHYSWRCAVLHVKTCAVPPHYRIKGRTPATRGQQKQDFQNVADCTLWRKLFIRSVQTRGQPCLQNT